MKKLFGKLTEEEIRQGFEDLAAEMLARCEGWENEPVNPELGERIIAAIKEKYPKEFK